jgi:hypothetical protein
MKYTRFGDMNRSWQPIQNIHYEFLKRGERIKKLKKEKVPIWERKIHNIYGQEGYFDITDNILAKKHILTKRSKQRGGYNEGYIEYKAKNEKGKKILLDIFHKIRLSDTNRKHRYFIGNTEIIKSKSKGRTKFRIV